MWSRSSSPSHRDDVNCPERSWAARGALGSVPRRRCQTQVFKGGNSGDDGSPPLLLLLLPGSPLSLFPSVPGLLGPSGGCGPRSRTSVPPASDAAHAGEAACPAPGRFGPKQGFRNQMCVVAVSCVSPPYFNTKFITCSEINVRRYFLRDRVLTDLICFKC